MANYVLTARMEVHPGRMGGRPCLVGRRMTVSQVLAELAEGRSLQDFEDDLGIPKETIVDLLRGLARLYDEESED